MSRPAAELLQTAIAHHQAGRLAEAEALYRRILTQAPRDPNALYLLGVARSQQGYPVEAAALLERALAAAGPNPVVLNELGKAYFATARAGEAKQAFARAAALQPDLAEAHGNLGAALLGLGETAEAATALRRALGLLPAYPNAHFNLGRALARLGDADAAERSFREALALAPGMADAHVEIANLRRAALDLDGAASAYRSALALQPSAPLHCALASVLYEQDDMDAAEASFREALALDSYLAEARWSLAILRMVALDRAGRAADAQAEISRLGQWLDERPGHDPARVVGAVQPFDLAYREKNHRELIGLYGALCCALMRRSSVGARLPDRPRPATAAGTRLRVGIVSAHIHDHSVWNAIVAGWVRFFDRARFEVSLFHLGARHDAATDAARAGADRFVDAPRPVSDWAETIVDARPDVLVYPEVGMDPTTLRLAALRLAPLQLAAWGHPLTTGLPTIDAYLSAEAFEPEDAADHYTERLVALPGLGCAYARVARTAGEFDRATLGADTGTPLLVCPGTPFKYAPEHDRLYPEIARRLGAAGGRFVFFAQTPRASCEALERRLRDAFAASGLDYERFVAFVPVMPRPAFHALLRGADLMLDTPGFSGFNTAMQAIECGLPIVAREGRFMRGRFASGILRRMGMDDCVATRDEDWARLAAELAGDAARRRDARARIEARRDALFDDPAPVRALERMLESLVPGA